MSRFDDDTTDGAQVAGMLLIFLLIVGLVMYHSPAESQAPRYQGARLGPGAVLTLAQMCAGERSPLHLDACTTMVGVIARTAARRGISIATQARAYSAVFKGESRPWLRELTLRGTRPPSWPRASWARYRPAWLHLVTHVRGVLDGEEVDTCDSAPVHFGSLRLDGGRAERAGWVRVCADVDSAQGFWVVP